MSDTRQVAEKIANTYGLTGNDLHKRTLADAIDAALRNERERCAKIAETSFEEYQTGYNAGRFITNAIRNDKGVEDGK